MKQSAFSSTTITFLIINVVNILLAQQVISLGSGSTIAISYNFNLVAVCGIIAGEPTQSIQCYKQGQIISVQPAISYESISGGLGYFCGLKSGGLSLLCWDIVNFHAKRIYFSSNKHLRDLTVGNSQVCAVQAINNVALCWRFQSPEVDWRFSTITSGAGFSCGILKNNSRVTCWGVSKVGAGIQRQFGGLTMQSLVAGESHACGMTKNGTLICKGSNVGGQLDVPSHAPFEFTSLALGANHSCGIRTKNGLVVCWGRGSKRLELVNNVIRYVSFESITAGLYFTCGLTTKNFSIICWGPRWSGDISLVSVLPLAMVIPGRCVQEPCSVCGVYPNSDGLCAGSGNICKSCEIELPIPAIIPPILPSGPSSETRKTVPMSSKTKNKLFLAFGIVGSIGTFAGISTLAYCFWSGLCGILHQRMYNIVQPTKARSNTDNVWAANGAAKVPPRSSSTKTSTSWKLSRQRSGSSSKYTERAEIFSLSELAAATSNFALGNKIGSGSFGIVYRGKLADGHEVAIKRGDSLSNSQKFPEKLNAFNSELVLLSRLHHKHLVGLVGFCQENDERLLVYEYMSNGALYDHLHSISNVETSSSILNSWKMRIKVALDAARGIEYLHNYAVPPIIHRDIKSSNILLDANWTAKVSDFGLSLMKPESEQESMSTKAAGTIGYIDPECYVLNILTTKSDVYALGVVLLELLTGKKAVFRDEESGDPVRVVEYARPKISAGELKSVLDKRVGSPEMKEVEAVELVAHIALHCVNLEGKERPTMSDIVANLEGALSLCEDSHGSFSSVAFSIASQ